MQKKSRANFLYRIGVVDTKKILLIWDEDSGNRSVTNDIENVVGDIAQHESINPTQYGILYRDSEGIWDGWDASTGNFFPFPLPEKIRQSIAGQLNFDFESPK